MTSNNKKNENECNRLIVSDWKRPDGPLNVWKIVDGELKLTDGTNKQIRFSIQDIPEDRYDEAIEHMCKYFMADEATCKTLKLKDDPDAVNDFHLLWDYLLKKKMSVAAYTLDSEDKIDELAALNILFIVTQEIEDALEHFTKTFKSRNARKLFEFMHNVSAEADPCKIYGVDKYLSALGLSVEPKFRGQKLGVRLLEARDDIGRKYGITASSTAFTAPASQIQAERAGFKTVFIQNYDEVVDADGKLLFPDINAKALKMMIKELR